MSFESLYQQILTSENDAKELQESISKVNKDIAECNAEIRKVRAEIQSVQERINNVELPRMYEAQTEREVTELQVKVLMDRRACLLENVARAEDELRRNQADQRDHVERFLTDVARFVDDYDLLSSGREDRHRARTLELAKLRELEARRTKEKEDAQDELDQLLSAQANEACLKAEISSLQASIIDEDQRIEAKREEAAKARDDVIRLKAAPRDDPEFVRLRSELASLNCSQTMDEISKLRAELDNLQRAKWQKTISNRQATSNKIAGYKFRKTNEGNRQSNDQL